MIEYKVVRAGARDLAVDVHSPMVASHHTAVILLHGGGWAFGERGMMTPYARCLAALGYTAIAAEYRLSAEAIWPAQIADVRDVLAWVRQHADELDIDPLKIAVEGFSAGAHLALIAGSSAFGGPLPNAVRPSAVISLFAPAVLTLPPAEEGMNIFRALLGPGSGDDDARDASPMTHIGHDFPPTFILSGTEDKLTPPTMALNLFRHISEQGGKCDLHLYHGHTHEFAALPSMLEPVHAEIDLFLRRSIVDPEHYNKENLSLNMFANVSAS